MRPASPSPGIRRWEFPLKLGICNQRKDIYIEHSVSARLAGGKLSGRASFFGDVIFKGCAFSPERNIVKLVYFIYRHELNHAQQAGAGTPCLEPQIQLAIWPMLAGEGVDIYQAVASTP
jgi:hypothetical protein